MPDFFTGSSQPAGVPVQRMMTCMESVQSCVEKYICFTGRASRSEYWWWTLLYTLPQVLLFPCIAFSDSLLERNYLIFALYMVYGAGIVPAATVSVRRLHDTGLSGWWLLLFCVPAVLGYALWLPWVALISLCLIIYFQSRPSEKRANKYGDIPCACSLQPADVPGQKKLSFTESAEACLKKSFCFTGRASRSEYWWWTLAYLVVMFLLLYSSLYFGQSRHYALETTGMIVVVLAVVFGAGIVPTIAVSIRRLHDTGLSGWWHLLFFVPLILGCALGRLWGIMLTSCIVVYFQSRPSEKRANKYGDVPCREPAQRA